MKKVLIILTALLAVFSQSALSHSLYVIAQYDGKQITGKAYYSDMTPAAETYVEAYPQGQQDNIVSGKTDETGRFSLQASGEHLFKVVVEGEEGHRATVIANRIHQQAANNDNALILLREDIAQLRDKIYWRDVIGGIGYIVGIIGLWALWQSRRTLTSGKRD
ncbi:carboxypeptidase regulatory-like domain-containing protein [Pasteurellaceae bacterium 22721_9_1]